MSTETERDSGTPTAREGIRAAITPPTKGNGGQGFWQLLETDLGWFGFARTPIRAEQVIERAALPAAHRVLIARVVKRTKLWRRERADVARELVAHFVDGIGAGASEAGLVSAFGDERRAASLIRRAKKRGRGVVWQVWKRGWQGAGCVVLLAVGAYLYFGLRVWTSSPSITRNYVAELNAPALAVPESERGWPLVREAILAQAKPPTFTDEDGKEADVVVGEARPGTKHWSQVVSHLRQSERTLSLLRAASAKPALARRLVLDDDRELMVAVHGMSPTGGTHPPPEYPDMIGILLPHLGSIRQCGRLLLADALLAVSESQSERVVEDVRAALWLGEHTGEGEILVSRLVGLTVFQASIQVVAEMVAETPSVLSEEQWRSIAHSIASAHGGGRIILPLGSERAMFDDVLQRTFSDDGRGGGTLTSEGLNYLSSMGLPGELNLVLGKPTDSSGAFAPIAAAIIADRRSQREMFDGIVCYQEFLAGRPLWEQPTKAEVARRIDGPLDGPFARERFAPVALVLPALRKVYFWGESVTQERDALLVAIALEIFHRRHAAYPASLAELVPALLPAVPPDRYTGKPLNYVLIGARPVLYSVGTDLDDDAGLHPAKSATRTRVTNRAADWIHPAELERLRQERPDSIPDGDWVLYPPLATREE